MLVWHSSVVVDVRQSRPVPFLSLSKTEIPSLASSARQPQNYHKTNHHLAKAPSTPEVRWKQLAGGKAASGDTRASCGFPLV